MRRRKPKFTSEAELAKFVVDMLENDGWTTYKEVDLGHGGTVDIVATQNGLLWAIETKTAFGIKVCEQAHRHLGYFHYVSIAVPSYSVSSNFMRRSLVAAGIGVLGVDGGTYVCATRHVTEELDPRFNHKPKLQRVKHRLFEESKRSVAGSLAGGSVTPYKLTLMRVKEFVTKNGPSDIKTILNNIQHHYRTLSTARQCLLKNIATLHRLEFEVKKDGKRCLIMIR